MRLIFLFVSALTLSSAYSADGRSLRNLSAGTKLTFVQDFLIPANSYSTYMNVFRQEYTGRNCGVETEEAKPFDRVIPAGRTYTLQEVTVESRTNWRGSIGINLYRLRWGSPSVYLICFEAPAISAFTIDKFIDDLRGIIDVELATPEVLESR
jgi:hypothetical protein